MKMREEARRMLAGVQDLLQTGSPVTVRGIRRLQSPRGPTTAERPPLLGSVLVLLDTSDSMLGEKLEFAKRGCAELASQVTRAGFTAGLITFASDSRVRLKATVKPGILAAHLETVSAGGGTRMLLALEDVERMLRVRGRGRCGVVVATDGHTLDQDVCLELAHRLRRRNVRIGAIGTDDADMEFLNQLTGHSGRAIYAGNPETFGTAIGSSSRLLLGEGSGGS